MGDITQTIAYLEAVIGADITNFRRGMRDVRNELGLLRDNVNGLARLGRTLTFGLTVPILGLGGAAVKAAGDFDAAMRNINSISFMTEQELAGLSERVLEFGSSIRSGPQAAAEALYTVFSAGITDVDTAFMAMKIGALTAEAGLADLTETTEGLIAAALTWGDQSEAALNRYSDATTLAVQLGVGFMDTFNTGFANVMGSAAALGITFEDMAASVSFLTQRGVDAAAAGTYLNNALSKLMKPGEELSAMFETLGVDSGRELIETFGGIEGALRAIFGVIGDDESKWAALFPDVRGFRAVSRIFTAFEEDGVDAVSEFWGNFEEKMLAGGLTMAAWEQQMMSFEAQWGQLTAAAQGFAIAVGQAILPLLLPFVNGLRDLFLNLSQTNPELLKMGVVIAGVVAAAGPLLWLLTSLISPFGVIAGAAAAFALDVGGVRTSLENMIPPGIKDALADLGQGILDFFNLFTQTQPESGDLNFTDFLPAAGPEFSTGASGFFADQLVSALATAEGAVDPEHLVEGPLSRLISRMQTASRDVMAREFAAFDRGAGGASGADVEHAFRMFEQAGSAAEDVDNSIGGRFARAIDGAWPTISDALTRLKDEFISFFTSTFIPAVGDWAATDGATALGDALGSMIGGLGGSIVDALNGGDKAGAGAGGDTSTFFDRFADNFIQGLRGGFERALAGKGINSVGEVVVAAIAGSIALVAVASLAGNLIRLGIGGIISGALNAALGAGSALTGRLAFAGGRIVGSLASAIASAGTGPIVKALGDGTFQVVQGAGLGGFASRIASGLAAALTSTAGIIAGGLTAAITAAAFYFSLPDEAKQQLQNTLWGWMDGVFGPGTVDTIERNFENQAYAALAGIARLAGNEDLSQQFLGMIQAPMDVSQATITLVGMPRLQNNTGLTPELILGSMGPMDAGGGIVIDAEALQMSNLAMQATSDPNFLTAMGGGLATATSDALSTVAADPEVAAAATAIGPVLASSVEQGMLDAIASGETSPTAIGDALIGPIEDAFITAFGVEGTATLAWTGFVTQLGTDLINTGIGFVNFKDVAVGAWGEIGLGVQQFSITAKSALFAVADAIKTVILAIHDLQGAAGSLATTNLAPSVSGVPVAGARAGGGPVLSGSAYLVGERGPELFVPGSSGSIVSNSDLSGSGGDVIYVNIYEASDLEKIRREARRQGLRIFDR